MGGLFGGGSPAPAPPPPPAVVLSPPTAPSGPQAPSTATGPATPPPAVAQIPDETPEQRAARLAGQNSILGNSDTTTG